MGVGSRAQAMPDQRGTGREPQQGLDNVSGTELGRPSHGQCRQQQTRGSDIEITAGVPPQPSVGCIGGVLPCGGR